MGSGSSQVGLQAGRGGWRSRGGIAFAGVAVATVLACQAGAQSTPAAGTPPTGQDEKEHAPLTKDQAKDLFRSVDEILTFVSQDTKLPILHPVKRKLITRDEVNKYLRDKFAEDEGAKRLARSEIVLKKFGLLDRDFKLQPFIVTLAGMFLARGACFLITTQSITINDPSFHALSGFHIDIHGASITAGGLIAIATLLLAIFVAHFTRFGRNVYAVGGNERSALLMGLPVARTKVGVYALSGFCSALGGVVFTLYVLSGYGLQGQGMELDAIAATVIGGTLLTGGVGYVIGSVFGVGILGTIQTLITFDGTLSSWWTRIVIGALLCAFCLLQRVIERHAARRKSDGTASGERAGSKLRRHAAQQHDPANKTDPVALGSRS